MGDFNQPHISRWTTWEFNHSPWEFNHSPGHRWPGELRVLPELSMLRDINQILGEYTKNDRVYHGRSPCSHPIGKKNLQWGRGTALQWVYEGMGPGGTGLEIINFFHII